MRAARKPERPVRPGSQSPQSEVPSARRRKLAAGGSSLDEAGAGERRLVVGFVTPPLARALELVWGEVVVCVEIGEALRACASRRPEVLLVDEDCLDAPPERTVAELRGAMGRACPYILLLTAVPWLDAGADRAVAKPIEATALAGMLDAIGAGERAVLPGPAPVGENVPAGDDLVLERDEVRSLQPASGKVKRSAEAGERGGRYRLDGPALEVEEVPVVVISKGSGRAALCAAFARVASQVTAADPDHALEAITAAGRCLAVVWAPDRLDTLLLASVLPPGVSLLSLVPVPLDRRGRTLRRTATGYELDWPAPATLLRRAITAMRATSIPPVAGV